MISIRRKKQTKVNHFLTKAVIRKVVSRMQVDRNMIKNILLIHVHKI